MVYRRYNKTISHFNRLFSGSRILNLHEANRLLFPRRFKGTCKILNAFGRNGGSRWICAEKCKRANERSVDVRCRLWLSRICSVICKLIEFIWSCNDCSDQKIRIGVVAVEIIWPTFAWDEFGMNSNWRQRWGSVMNPLGKARAVSHHVWQIQRVFS